MIDADDVSVGFIISIPLGIIFLIWYLVFSVPEIDKCHERGGSMVKIDGVSKCVDVSKIQLK